jgi:hypothetical protein
VERRAVAGGNERVDDLEIIRERIPDVLAWTARGLVESALAEA